MDMMDFVDKMDFWTVSKPYPFSDFHGWGWNLHFMAV